MYKEIIHNNNNLSTLQKNLTQFRAKITARKLLSMGIKEEDLYTLTAENAYISEKSTTI